MKKVNLWFPMIPDKEAFDPVNCTGCDSSGALSNLHLRPVQP